jgi:hypothetical protein
MKKNLFIFLSFLNVLTISAQDKCLTIAPEPPSWIFNKSMRLLDNDRSYSLNIFVHIVRSSSGQGLSTNIISTIMNSLNSSFYDANIQFSLLGMDVIENDYFYTNLIGRENQLMGMNAHCNAIDIYVLGESTIWTGAGLANGIPSKALIVHGGYYNTSTLPHEMGHCLGLYHTHHGTVNEGGGDTNQCPELVNGSKSFICGDYISDTPADPSKWSSSSCVYIGTDKDANGDYYIPNSSNFMTYAYKPCRFLFSNLQIDRMKDFIDNSVLLQKVFHLSISGPSTVCSTGATFNVTNLPSGYSVTWDKSSNLTYISGQNTNSYVVKSNGIGPAWVQAAINGSCVGTVNLTTGDIWSGLPSGYEIDGPSVIQLNNSTPYHYIATGNGYSHLQGISSIGWTSSTNIGFVYGTNGQYDAYARGLSVGDGTINFYTTNNCGTTTFDYLVWISKNPRMTIYPNPATDIITVTIDSSNEMLETSLVKKTEIKYSGSYEIQIWNERQGLVRIIRDSKSTEQISLEGLSKGMYYLHLVKNKETLQKQLFWII